MNQITINLQFQLEQNRKSKVLLNLLGDQIPICPLIIKHSEQNGVSVHQHSTTTLSVESFRKIYKNIVPNDSKSNICRLLKAFSNELWLTYVFLFQALFTKVISGSPPNVLCPLFSVSFHIA